MKKTLRTLLMGLAALLAGNALTSCSNDDELQVAPEGQKGYVEFTLSRGADTRTAYELTSDNGLKATWSEGDKVVVIYHHGESDEIAEVFDLSDGADSDTATFAKEDSQLADKSGDLWILYFPGYDSNESFSANTFDFSEQTGTLEDLGKYDYFTCSATLDNGKITPSAAISPSMTILRFPEGIDFGTGEGEMTKDIVFSGGRHILVPFENITEEQVGDITIKDVSLTDGKLAADLYVSVYVSDTGKYAPTSVTVGGKVFIIPQVKERGLIYTFEQSNLKALEADPLTLEAIEAGTITISNPLGLAISYLKNMDTRVTSTGNIEISVAKNDVVRFYGDNATYATGDDSNQHTNIQCTNDCYIYGNIMSLIDSKDYATKTELTEDLTFCGLFQYNTHIKKHKSKALMLPATTLANYCYFSMFRGCTNLTKAPELPATTLAKNCYDSMFQNCYYLIHAPELKATTLADYCYNWMFEGCINLKRAPELKATTLAQGCYFWMFHNCTSLEAVTCLATDISAFECIYGWLEGVADEGTFTKAAGMTGWTTNSESGIPSGWTVEDYKE